MLTLLVDYLVSISPNKNNQLNRDLTVFKLLFSYLCKFYCHKKCKLRITWHNFHHLCNSGKIYRCKNMSL